MDSVNTTSIPSDKVDQILAILKSQPNQTTADGPGVPQASKEIVESKGNGFLIDHSKSFDNQMKLLGEYVDNIKNSFTLSHKNEIKTFLDNINRCHL